MPESRSKYSNAAAARRKKTVRNVLFGVLIVFAVVFVVMAGRYIYGKSKDPNYRLADLFHSTKAVSFPTLPINTLPDVIPSTPETAATGDTQPEASSEEETTEESSSEGIPDTTEETSTDDPDSTAEETAEDTTEEQDTEAPSESEYESSADDETSGETEATTEEETTEEEATTTEAPVAVDPTDINYHLLRNNMTESDLGRCTQLIVTKANGTQCMLYFFEKTADGWTLSDALPSAPGIVGANGVSSTKSEGDLTTPKGYFKLGPCFGEDATSLTSMEYHQITAGDYWVDDPDSQYYNHLIHEENYEARTGWNSAEHLIDAMPDYRYLVVIRYNMDIVVPGAGSAIFLHCQADKTTTLGCVATKEATMFAIFRWLNPNADPHILIY